MARKNYYVNGMHCPACEINIERVVKKIKGVSEAKASLVDSKLSITSESANELPSIHNINSNLKKYGYSVSSETERAGAGRDKARELFFASLAFLMVASVFVFIGGTDFLSGIYVSQESNAAAFFGFGIAAGISSCAALVGGLLLTVQSNWIQNANGREGKHFLPFILFNASRLITFAVLGGLLGLLGRSIKISISGSAILTIVVSIFMVLVGMQMLGIKWMQRVSLNPFRKVFNSGIKKSNSNSSIYPIAIGAITFFIPCGFTIIAQTQAIAAGSFQMGFLSLGAFALGTLPVLALISFTSVKFFRHPKFSNVFQLFSGMMVIFFALFTLNGQMGVLGLPNLSTNSTQSIISDPNGEVDAPVISLAPESTDNGDGVQIMQMEVNGFEYFPKVIRIQANIPTRFEIIDNGSIGCARAVYPRGIYDQIINLQPGLNTVDFISPAQGTYQISCSMWMVEPITVIVE